MFAVRATHAFDGTRFLPGGATVVVDGDRIAGVETGRVELPADVEVREYAGTVLPGLIDCHTHLLGDDTPGGLERNAALGDDALDEVIVASLGRQAAAGVTTVRDLGDRGYRALAFRSRPGLPRVVASGPPLTTPGGHCHFWGGAVAGPAAVPAAILDHADHGVDVVKVMASGGFNTPGTDLLGVQFTAEVLRAIVDEAHRVGLAVLAHAHSLAGIRQALDAGVDGVEHFTAITLGGLRLDDELLDEVAARGVVVDPTLGNDLSRLAELPGPPPVIVEAMARLGLTPKTFLAERIAAVHRFREHGVRVVTGVDSGVGPGKPHGSAWRAVGDLVQGGYPASEALATATSLAAEACGLAGETGRLEPGRAADVLVVGGDLEADVACLARPLAVVVRGDRMPEARPLPARG